MYRFVCLFLGRSWHFNLWFILLNFQEGVILYLEPLERNYHAGQLGQLLGMMVVYWSSTHFGHCVDFQF